MTTTLEHAKAQSLPPLASNVPSQLPSDLSWERIWGVVNAWLATHPTHCRQNNDESMVDEQRLASWIHARVLEQPIKSTDNNLLTSVVQSLLSIQRSRGVIIIAPNSARWVTSVESYLTDTVLAHPLYNETLLDHCSPPHAFADERRRVSPRSHDTYVLPYTLWVDADQWPRLLKSLEDKPMANPPMVVLCEPQSWFGSVASLTVLARTLTQFESNVIWLGPNPLSSTPAESTLPECTLQWRKLHCLTVAHKWQRLTQLFRQQGIDAILVDTAYERDRLTERLSAWVSDRAARYPDLTCPRVACWADCQALMDALHQTRSPEVSSRQEWQLVSWSTPAKVLPWLIQCTDTLKHTRLTVLHCRDDHRFRQQKVIQAPASIPVFASGRQQSNAEFSHLQLERYAEWCRQPCDCAPSIAAFSQPPQSAKTTMSRLFSRFSRITLSCDQCHSISSAWRNLYHLLLY